MIVGKPDFLLDAVQRGYIEQPLIHPHFGPSKVDVFAIDLTAPVVPIDVLYGSATAT
jgi:hypothetical protein